MSILFILLQKEKRNIMARTRLLWLLIFAGGRLLAQDAGQRQSIDDAGAEYLRVAAGQSALYYGDQQQGHRRASNHPYLADEQYAKARLSYLQVIYPEAMLRLDLDRDELVILSPDRHNIVLFPENVDFAELHGRRVIYFRRDSLPGCPSPGYYLLLHSGKCKVLGKRSAALMHKETHSSVSEQLFVFTANYYLLKDGVYHRITTKRGLLKILHPYKKELRRFISTNRLRFRRDAEELLSRTVSEYEKLSGT
jgi:hypothetical protein